MTVPCPKCPRCVPDGELVRINWQLAVCRWCARDMVDVALGREIAVKADEVRDDFEQVRR